jgi:hypothetical protein
VGEAEGDLGPAGDVEARAARRQHLDDLRRRVGLDRIINAGDRQIAAQHVVGLADHLEIDDEARRLGRMLGQEAGDLVVHHSGGPFPKTVWVSGIPPARRSAPERRQAAGNLRRRLAQTARIGDPRTPPAAARAAQIGFRRGRDGPCRDCNHIDLPLGTGGDTGLPKRTRYVVA